MFGEGLRTTHNARMIRHKEEACAIYSHSHSQSPPIGCSSVHALPSTNSVSMVEMAFPQSWLHPSQPLSFFPIKSGGGGGGVPIFSNKHTAQRFNVLQSTQAVPPKSGFCKQVPHPP